MLRVSADNYTREQLGITEEEVTPHQARQIMEKVADDKNYKVSMGPQRLVIQRFIRD